METNKTRTLTYFPFNKSLKIVDALLESSDEMLRFQIDVAICVRKCRIMLERSRFYPKFSTSTSYSTALENRQFQALAIFFKRVTSPAILYQSEQNLH